MQHVVALTTTDGTIIIAVMLIVAVTAMVIASLGKSDSTQKSVFALAGVMIGLLSGGAIGTLTSTKAADDAADQVSSEVQKSVDEATQP